MAFTHSIGRKTSEHYLAPHPHDTAAQARECEEQHAADVEGHLQQQAELATEQRYERWLEDGGERADIIAAEDAMEREREAHDPFLQALRAGREDENACRGGVCTDIHNQCTRHSNEYQDRYGRAANE